MIDLLLAGVENMLHLKYLVPLFLGTLVGLIGGALPGVTITMTIIIVLPFTFGLDPLAGLKAYMSLLRNPKRLSTLQETAQAYEIMGVCVGQMELLLSNALDLFKTTTATPLVPELIDVGVLAREALSLYYPVARSKHIDLKFQVPERGLALMADRKLLRRIITNLVSNALKYTPEKGSITVAVSDEKDGLQFSVSDTGYGINKEDEELLFSKFYKKSGAGGKKTKIPGSGLGLVLARKAVELHRGRIWVESEKGKGSTFKVLLPKLASGDFI